MDVCRVNKNFGKMVSAYLAYNSIEIERNFRHGKNHNKENKSRLWYSYKDFTFTMIWSWLLSA